VLRVLAVYLLVLVPVNWALFRAIGRVEWAWFAAPVIAVCGAMAVVRLAQLDIGFARSRTEVAVLELQGGHARGHLTRYMALYTSLSTSYDLTFDEPTALVQPLGDPQLDEMKRPAVTTVTFQRDDKVHLRGFRVGSNSTGMIHSEEMRGIGGAVVLQAEQQGLVVVNKSDITLKDVGVIRRVPQNETGRVPVIQVAWVGELEPKTNKTLRFAPAADTRMLLREWQNSPITATQTPEGEVSLLRILDLARDPRRLNEGDLKLIGWTDADLGGLELRPRASQTTLRTLVIANLQHGLPPAPRPDENTYARAKEILDGLNPVEGESE
jgi:hypothetical protein